MQPIKDCLSIEEVRAEIDRIDTQIVTLIAERGCYVNQAARFKKDTTVVKAPDRVEKVIAKVVTLANELKTNPHVVEQVYRTMIQAFITLKLTEYSKLTQCTDSQ